MGMNAMGRSKKKQHNGQQQQQHQQRKKNGNANGFVKQPNSPFFYNNGGEHNNPRNGKQRNKSTGDPPIEVFNNYSSPANGTFYNDHLKLQNNSSTPIANDSPFMPSSTSAFRATNSDNKFKKNGKVKSNGKASTTMNQSMPGQQQPNGNHDQFKRKLFNESSSNGIKPFTMPDGMPESWKNFKFDPQKLFGSMQE